MPEPSLLGRTLAYKFCRVATPDGVHIAVQDWDRGGGGRDVLFIHGFGQSNLCWINQVTGALARRHRLVTYDLRGHGASDRPLTEEFYRDPERWAGEVRAIIDELRLVSPILVAWSYGGRVALDFLGSGKKAPIGGLVMVSATSTGRPEFFGSATPLLRALTEVADLAEDFDATRRFLKSCVVSPLDSEVEALMLAYNLAVPATVRKHMAGRPADYDAVLVGLQSPLLAIHGAQDAVNSPEMALHAARTCPGGQAIIYDDVGHIPFWESPERFDDDLGRFLDDLAAA